MHQAEPTNSERRYKGVRRRRWGKWVSEIRVPGTRERLWLGSYSTPEAAAVAHDTAVFFLRGPTASHRGGGGGLNFPDRVAGFAWASLSPTSIQRVASESGMEVDAQLAVHAPEAQPRPSAEGPEVRHMDSSSSWRERGDLGEQGLSWRSELIGDISFDAVDVHMLD